MKLFKMDALHYALLAVLVLLVLYCATGVLREPVRARGLAGKGMPKGQFRRRGMMRVIVPDANTMRKKKGVTYWGRGVFRINE